MRPLPDDDDEDLDTWDEGEEEYEEDDDDEKSAVLPCPSCRAEVYEDAVRCPVCGEYIVRRRLRAWEGKSTWWIVLGLIGMGAVIWALILR